VPDYHCRVGDGADGDPRGMTMREFAEADGGELHELGDDALDLVAGAEGAGFDPFG
jgi:hypothetical protein